ncbi:MAG: SDR family oxidoreductase [Ignavibacteriales bacterium]|nr:SDR family oxidoreductase [Ignavibacteriales bacterium]
MQKNRLLENKICLITGTSSGIGKSTAERFAEEGAIVYANSLNDFNIDVWASQYSEKFETKIIPLYFDVTDYQAVKNAVIRIKKEQNKIDVLVNNAGIVTYEFLQLIDLNKTKEMFDINVMAVINLIQLVTKLMIRHNSGSIINISSIVGDKGVSGQLAYSASKGAVIAITKSAAKELAKNNIRVNSIAPGMVATERLKKIMESSFKEKIENIGMGRLAEPEEIADACVFLASDLSSYISGQIIGVDGCTIL